MEDVGKGDRLLQILAILKRYDLLHGLSPQKLRNLFEDLGPTFIKFGQILSMRPDLIPKEYCKELVKLRSDVKPMPFDDVKEIICTEYGIESTEDEFFYISPTPVGSASIAQVHKAYLNDKRPVVIKVQRPGIRQKMYSDVEILRKALILLKLRPSLGNVTDFRTVLDELWHATQQELDFMVEASNLEEFAMLNEDISYISSPSVEKNLTTTHVLVMEDIDGIPISDLNKLEQQGYDLKEIAEKLAENYVKQLLDDGFFHGDPHPGNIFIQDGKIVWIDLGMVGQLTSRDKQLFTRAIIAIKNHDIYDLKSVVLAMGIQREKIDHAALYTDIEQIVNKYASLDFANINLGNVIMELNDLLVKYHIGVPSGIAMLTRGVITIEGVLEMLNPKLNFMDVIAVHLMSKKEDIAKEIKNMLSESAGSLKKGIDIPKYLADILQMTVKGQTKLNLELTGSEKPLREIDRMVDKLIVSIICAALLIGSSLLCTTDMSGKIFGIPALGIIGYFLSMVSGLWLVYGILKDKK